MSWIKKYKESVFCHTSKRQLYGLYCDLHLWSRVKLQTLCQQIMQRWLRHVLVNMGGWNCQYRTRSLHAQYQSNIWYFFKVCSLFYFFYHLLYCRAYWSIWNYLAKEGSNIHWFLSFIHRNTVDIFIDEPCSKKWLPC